MLAVMEALVFNILNLQAWVVLQLDGLLAEAEALLLALKELLEQAEMVEVEQLEMLRLVSPELLILVVVVVLNPQSVAPV
jgi:hypothetical protein